MDFRDKMASATLPERPQTRFQALLQQLPLLRESPILAMALGAAMAVLAWYIRWLIGDGLPAGFPYLTYFPAVILTAFFLGLRAGVVCAVISWVTAWYFFIAPLNSFVVTPTSAVALAFFFVIIVIDVALVHWMQRANANLLAQREESRRLAETRDLLFSELQHRVSNNLQIASSLLSLQRREVTDPAALKGLDEAARRLMLIGRISRQLYESDGARTSMDRFLQTLGDEVMDAMGAKLDTHYDVEPGLVVPSAAAVPMAIIFAEAFANAVEHGLNEAQAPRIDIRLRRPQDDQMVLEISDNGTGLPQDFALDKTKSLGLKIAGLLARQLKGHFSLDNRADSHGAVARLAIPAHGY